nr:transporter substrate-binding domain-containing protein [Pseudomonas sp. UBA6718]
MRILTLVLLLVCSPLHAGETWRVVGDEQFAPYSFVTMEDDTPHGVDVELIRAIMQAGAIDYQLRLYPWERVKRMLDRSEVDMAFQFAGTPERMAQYELVGPLRTGSTVFMTTHKIALQDWTSLDDFAPFVIGQVRGYAYQSDFDKADLARDTSAQNPRAQHNVRILPRPLVQMPRYVAFAKGDKVRAERFAEALKRVRASGELDKILQQWEQ